MRDLFLNNFATIYGLTYFCAITIVALWESLLPRRVLSAPLRTRWFSNFSIMLLDNALWRLVFPITAVNLALLAAQRGWGLFNVVDVSPWLAVLVSFFLIDLTRYGIHFSLHNVPVLWRVHRMHHTDHDYDFTTGLRFHPIEALLTICVNLAIIVILGAPALAVAIGELAVVAVAITSHGNMRIPLAMDRVLRRFVVTPDLHRVHHSIVASESNRNFATVIPWWDWLFGTYQAQPLAGHEAMRIGLKDYTGREHLGLLRMLVDPFVPVPSRSPGLDQANETVVP